MTGRLLLAGPSCERRSRPECPSGAVLAPRGCTCELWRPAWCRRPPAAPDGTDPPRTRSSAWRPAPSGIAGGPAWQRARMRASGAAESGLCRVPTPSAHAERPGRRARGRPAGRSPQSGKRVGRGAQPPRRSACSRGGRGTGQRGGRGGRQRRRPAKISCQGAGEAIPEQAPLHADRPLQLKNPCSRRRSVTARMRAGAAAAHLAAASAATCCHQKEPGFEACYTFS
mmetsp:Transcript_13165/g.38390  ORF Transcript_13165/g.38390 Transcript_13165/m.38390 type:complete len:227 (+) Transcript_13165:3-683(+)